MEKKIAYLSTQSFFEVFEERGAYGEGEKKQGTFEKKFKRKERIYLWKKRFRLLYFQSSLSTSEKPVYFSDWIPSLDCRLFD